MTDQRPFVETLRLFLTTVYAEFFCHLPHMFSRVAVNEHRGILVPELQPESPEDLYESQSIHPFSYSDAWSGRRAIARLYGSQSAISSGECGTNSESGENGSVEFVSQDRDDAIFFHLVFVKHFI